MPLKLSELREDPDLMEDVWITRSNTKVPRWLENRDVRRGIHAMLKVDHCLTERHRLGHESDNLCRWFGRELCAVELAFRKPKSELTTLTWSK